MPRLEFSSETKRAAYQRSRGVCECARIPFLRRPNGCGIVLGAGTRCNPIVGTVASGWKKSFNGGWERR